MNNSTNLEFDVFNLYERIGSTLLLDSVYIFIITPIGLIGFFLNLFSFYILRKIKIDQTMLYKYLAFYALNGSIICLLVSLTFTCYSPRYYPFYLSLTSRIIRAFIAPLISTIFYFVCNILDIFVALERLSIFVKTFRPLNKLNPFLVCLIIIVISLIINFPQFLSYYVKDENELYDQIRYNISIFNYNGRTPFFFSKFGTIITYVQIFIRDILTLLIELMISSLAFYYLRKFNQKQIDLNRIPSKIDKKRKEIMRKKIIKDRLILLNNLIQTILSFISHVLVSIAYFYASKGVTEDLFKWLCIGFFTISFKHFSFFFMLCFFNRNFRKQLFYLFGYKSELNQ